MKNNDPDPQPGDFDKELESIDPANVEIVDTSADRVVSIQVIVRGDEAATLEEIAQSRGQDPGEVVAALIREAAGRAA